MIKDIQELNFPKKYGKQYATLTQATITLQDMAEKTITSQVKINGDVTPDFSYDWEVEFQGEKFIMPLRQPQGAKENTSQDSTIDLTFQHWAIYQLKRWYFFTLTDVNAGTAVPDKYIASVSLNLKNFCNLCVKILNYYYGDKIILDLNPKWESASEPTVVEISHSYIWDVLIKLYDLYAVRWVIEPNGDRDHYVIKVGYNTTEISHIFEYGFKGGLLKVERQMQDESIRNMVIGRGGNKNLPYRYFKKHDENNESFSPDPDWVPELSDIYFSELHGATFRSYIQGWNCKHYKRTAVISADKAYAPWAWMRGFTDREFNPVEFVADEFDTSQNGYGIVKGSSINKYGELMGGLDNNEDIYPTIQGVEIVPYGRIDECVAVEKILSDDVEKSTEDDATVKGAVECKGTAANVPKSGYKTITLKSNGNFKVDKGQHANLDVNVKVLSVNGNSGYIEIANNAEVTSQALKVYNAVTGKELSGSGIPEGLWRYEVTVGVHNKTIDKSLNITVGDNSPKLTGATLDEKWGNTWNIWVKNIWQSTKQSGETNKQYAERIWRPILGNSEGNEAKVVFTTGALATSSDYEFTIVSIPVYDTSKDIDGTQSHWCITLAKSDADLESLGVYVPSTKRQAIAGDHFVFTGIDMPHMYVVKAEERLDDWKKDELAKVKEIKPTWVVGLDKVRINRHDIPIEQIKCHIALENGGLLLQENGELTEMEAVFMARLLDFLKIGNSLRLADKRFIEGDYKVLYLQSVTYNYIEATDKEANILPDVEVVLSDTYTTSANSVTQLSGELTALQKQIGSISNVEQIVRAVGDKLYLRKDGISDRSLSPTEFASLLTSYGFRNGIVGGKGWGFFKDENGNWVLETDRINVRQEMKVSTLMINQITGQGGLVVESAAQIEVTEVEETSTGYICHFDQKEGTVANLFHNGDIGYCTRFTPENADLKFYKRRVIGVGADYIILTKDNGILVSPGAVADNGVNGDGVPESGDSVVQFGNYVDKRRQYVKVRDVVDGGYERYLEDLNSVNAPGAEYYFVGRQDGDTPRWFIGNKNNDYAEFKGGHLRLNCDLTVRSTIDGQPIDEYTNKEPASVNIIRNTAFNQGLDKWLVYAGSADISIDKEVRLSGDASIRIICTGEIENQYYGIRQTAENILLPATKGEWITASVYARTDNIYSFDEWGGLEIRYYDTDKSLIGASFQRIAPTGNNRWEREHITTTCPEDTAYVGIAIYLNRNGRMWIAHPMMARGQKLCEWSASSHDFNYITEALKENTSIDGGLIQTSRLNLGYTRSDGTRVTTAGTSGIYNKEAMGGGLAFFAGGDGLQEQSTTFGIRMDGTGYAADHTIQFLKEALHIGGNEEIRLNKLGLFLYDGENIRLRVSNTPVEFDTEGISSPIKNIHNVQSRNKTAYTNYPFFNQFDFDSYALRNVSKGEIISMTVTIEVNKTWPGDTIYVRYPAMRVRIDAMGENIYMATTSFAPISGKAIARMPILLEAQKVGDFVITIDIVNYNIQVDTEPTTPCYATLDISGTRSKSISGQTLIGNNGLCSIWNNHALAINDKAFVARVGKMAIRITPENGIEKDNGAGWKPI